MTARWAVVVATAVALGASASAGLAQVTWDSPRMLGPESPDLFGVHWLRPASQPGTADAVFATLAVPGLGGRVLVRGGVGDGVGGTTAGFGGVDVHTAIARHDASQPLDVEWNAGAGVGVGEYVMVSVPFGVSAGRSWSSGSVWLAPYVGAGFALEYRIGDSAPDEEFVVEPSAEVGLDLSLDPGRRFVVRAAAAFGDRQAVVVGIAIGPGG